MAAKPAIERTAIKAGSLQPKGVSLSERAYRQIRNEILSGELGIGAILSRRRLAERLKMSFLPITEALGRLETEGLVESRPRVGTRVRIPCEQDIRDSYAIREALESQAARLCAEHMSAAEKKQLRNQALQLDELQKLSAIETADSRFLFYVHTFHMQFHLRIAELAGCRGLLQAIENLQVLIFNWLDDTAADRRTQPRGFHARLARALCSGDPLRADTEMRAHVRYGMEQVIERLAGYSSGDQWRSGKAQAG